MSLFATLVTLTVFLLFSPLFSYVFCACRPFGRPFPLISPRIPRSLSFTASVRRCCSDIFFLFSLDVFISMFCRDYTFSRDYSALLFLYHIHGHKEGGGRRLKKTLTLVHVTIGAFCMKLGHLVQRWLIAI